MSCRNRRTQYSGYALGSRFPCTACTVHTPERTGAAHEKHGEEITILSDKRQMHVSAPSARRVCRTGSAGTRPHAEIGRYILCCKLNIARLHQIAKFVCVCLHGIFSNLIFRFFSSFLFLHFSVSHIAFPINSSTFEANRLAMPCHECS